MTPWQWSIVIAGLLAGGISTFDSVGSALAALFTRDVYARILVKHADEQHYLRVSRISTFFVIGLSFAYIPFMGMGMVELFVQLVGIAVVPLLTIYLMGVLTPVHRSGGIVGLLVGMACGFSRFLPVLPFWWTNKWWGMLWGVAATAIAMLLTSLIRGWARSDELAGLTIWTARHGLGPWSQAVAHDQRATWLRTSQQEVPQMPPYPFPVKRDRPAWYQRPQVWAVAVLLVIAWLNLVVFW